MGKPKLSPAAAAVAAVAAALDPHSKDEEKDPATPVSQQQQADGWQQADAAGWFTPQQHPTGHQAAADTPDRPPEKAGWFTPGQQEETGGWFTPKKGVALFDQWAEQITPKVQRATHTVGMVCC